MVGKVDGVYKLELMFHPNLEAAIPDALSQLHTVVMEPSLLQYIAQA